MKLTLSDFLLAAAIFFTVIGTIGLYKAAASGPRQIVEKVTVHEIFPEQSNPSI